jgi:hypothetical protein
MAGQTSSENDDGPEEMQQPGRAGPCGRLGLHGFGPILTRRIWSHGTHLVASHGVNSTVTAVAAAAAVEFYSRTTFRPVTAVVSELNRVIIYFFLEKQGDYLCTQDSRGTQTNRALLLATSVSSLQTK